MRVVLLLILALAAIRGNAESAAFVTESARRIPVAYEVDVVVAGGSSGAVAAAVAAAEGGARVFLAAPHPYLGEDICATNRLWMQEPEKPAHPLAKALFTPDFVPEEQAVEATEAGQSGSFAPVAAYLRPPLRPLHVKKTLDQALLDAGVQFLYSCYPTEVLRDEAGELAGIVMVNRAGRQAVIAKVIIDATSRAAVARMAGARFAPYPAGEQEFQRAVIANTLRSGPKVLGRKLGYAGLVEYRLRVPMADGSFRSFARAEQVARDWTYTDDQQVETDLLFQVAPDPMEGEASADGEWTGPDSLPLGVFQPRGVSRLYVLGGCAAVSREQAEKLLRPLAFIGAGDRVGQAAAVLARQLKAPGKAAVAGRAAPAGEAGEVRETLGNVRPWKAAERTVASPERALPVLGRYDVVVVGAGTGGAPAAIAAARGGAKTLAIEYLHSMGGVGAAGRIPSYYWGNRTGFTKQIPFDRSWEPVQKAEWWRKSFQEGGGESWFGVLGCGAFVRDGRVKGVVVATPEARGVVLADVVIDSTGNSDVAAAAGAETMYTGADEVAVQGAGLPRINLGETGNNTDFTLIDETDMLDAWHLLVYAKHKHGQAFDVGQLLQTRERRRIVGDFVMTVLDQLNHRAYPDTISTTYSNFDSHGYTVDPFFLLDHPEKEGIPVNIPYRCLLPKGLDGILVTGLGISVHRDAVPLVRMQADIQNQGYAAGTAAAMIAASDSGTRELDIQALQRKLAELEIIPESAIGATDSMPFPPEKIAGAVRRAAEDAEAIAVLMTQPEEASPLLRAAYQKAEDEEARLLYAHILAVLGDNTGLGTLVRHVDSREWDQGWNYTGMSQFGSAFSRLDALIVAMGRTRDPRALAPIFRKMKTLNANSEFSHHRAVALALESIGDASAAGPLTQLLKKPRMLDHAAKTVDRALERNGPDLLNTEDRAESIRELGLGRALYRCGDNETGLGKWILDQYSEDLRGHLARHAQAVLERPALPRREVP